MKLKFLLLITATLVMGMAAIATPASAEHRLGLGGATSTDPTIAGGALIAPPSACPHQSQVKVHAFAQQQRMLCMTNFARRGDGLDELSEVGTLDISTEDKSRDVLNCDDFSHFACDRPFEYWMEETGYLSTPCWRVGENLAWGTGAYGSVRAIFRAWMRSPGHRQNILGDYIDVGINLAVGDLDGQDGTRVWVSHFGSHCER